MRQLKTRVKSVSRGTDGRTKKLNGKTGLIGKPKKKKRKTNG